MSADTQHRSPARFFRDDEQGIAMLVVLLAVVAIGGIVVLMFASARFEIRATEQAAAQEAALHIAEGGVEAVFGRMHQDGAYTTVDSDPDHEPPSGGFASDSEERAWVLGLDVVADTRVETRNGFGYGIGPVELDDRRYVYGVGELGAGADPLGRRVVRVEVTAITGALAGSGILSNGDITFKQGGSTTVTGNVHANCNLTIEQNTTIEGNATAHCDYTESHTNVDVSGDAGGGYSELELPVVDFEEFYEEHVTDEDLDWYDLCRTSSGQGRVYPGSEDGPCDTSQTPLATLSGNQSWNGWRYDDGDREWRLHNPHNPAGVFYAHELNIHAANSSGERTTLIASTAGDNGFTGNVVVAAPVSHYLTPWAVMAEIDIDGTQGGSKTVDGLMYSGQQLQMEGAFSLTGSMIIHDAEPTSPDQSPITEISFGGGGSTTIQFVQAYDIFDSGLVHVFSWRELFP